ncbi:TspO/MBR family protein [Aidingimonas lacisalsi]|uniref:TspO/MBR family protein n=1 Tax=Aidingimonas lacisalsi TaxID=2604086 RepID=UPI0011D1803D|nr:TspO/MBR family protein [Aidingimonas lacisalsi]
MTVSARQSLTFFLGWLLLVALVSLSGVATPPGEWYAGLTKPPFTPPNLLFPVAWTLLYLLMAVAAWRVTCLAPPGGRVHFLWPFVAQLAANGLWSLLFFGLHWMLVALLDLGVLLGLLVLTLRRFHRVSVTAFWLLVPYLLWVVFASYLNAAIWWLN